MARRIRGDSTEWLTITITANVDISDDDIEVSFDDGIHWHATEHVSGGVRVLVGPAGTATLPTGASAVLVRIHDTPEIPVLTAGSIYVSI